MKKNINIIQVNGIKGLLVVGFIACCLFAGFVIFPGFVAMHIWNYAASYSYAIPSIGIFQGVLLWGIVAVAYFAFRKRKLIVCMKSPQGLNEDELKTIFEDLKKQAQEDIVKRAMVKAKELEDNTKETVVNTANSDVNSSQDKDV